MDGILSLTQGKSDTSVAHQLAGLAFTERLPDDRLAGLDAAAPGPESRKALLLLADLSAFLNPPASAILTRCHTRPREPAPDHLPCCRLRQKDISHLPSFFATRNTLRFEDTPRHFGHSLLVPYQPLHQIGTSNDAVSYRGGREVVNAGAP